MTGFNTGAESRLSVRIWLGTVMVLLLSVLALAAPEIDAGARKRNADLLAAAQRGHVARVQELLDQGANVNARDEMRRTPLMATAGDKTGETIRLLLANGADVHARTLLDSTALHAAARAGNTTVIRLLLDADAEIDAQDQKGVTPLMKAAIYDQPEAVTLLIDRGASVDYRRDTGTTESGTTLLRVAYASGTTFGSLDDERPQARQAQMLELLMSKGADPNARTPWGQTALIWVVGKGNLKAAKALLARGADPNAENKRGGSALLWARTPEIADFLLSQGARLPARCAF